MSLGPVPTQAYCLFLQTSLSLRDFFDRFFLAAILITMFISGCSALGVCDLNVLE